MFEKVLIPTDFSRYVHKMLECIVFSFQNNIAIF